MAIWNEGAKDQLISLIQERPALFDITEKWYANRIVKTGLWREIETQLGLSEKELKKKWDSLRTQYTRHPESSDDEDESASPALPAGKSKFKPKVGKGDKGKGKAQKENPTPGASYSFTEAQEEAIEPSQGPSAIFWHAKDVATAHEVSAGA
ncbi:hypothetical protein NQZ68_014411 [Dissostichus eleginoides]|nr:hypothetical protein NQZ68_014411 [Dissostichus eleginoides]